MKKVNELIAIYRQMSAEQLQDEIDSLFDLVYAILEATDSDSIEQFPNVNIRLRISCDVIKDEGRFYC
jgi:hypothetical protein